MSLPARPVARALRRVLIANRGEIAVRVARACRELGIESVAAASAADLRAMHARAADRVVAIGPAAAAESYLRGDVLIAAARELGCDAIHPGYGFLSQNAEFADAVESAGIAFVGPRGASMRVMGEKTAARRAMSAAGVPVVPGFEGTGREGLPELEREAARIGFPLLVKAAAGGGGRGMRIVRAPGELAAALEGAAREAEKAFGNGRLFLERFLERAHHVEIQVLADEHGSTIHLGERECSVQRRYQKIVEEAPSPLLDEALRARMGAAAVRAAEACGYRSAGTIEFLVAEDRSFYFLEMNTRVQVEHPVTEMVTGIDIVAEQLRVAAGQPLSVRQEDVRARGHAIECRLNAEDAGAGFAPSTGVLAVAMFPALPGVRVDQGYESGDEVSIHYDSLLAKVIVHAADRPAAIRRAEAALARTYLLGVATNREFVQAVLAHPVFARGEATTTFVADHLGDFRPAAAPPDDDALLLAALADELAAAGRSGGGAEAADGGASGGGPWDRADSFRLGGS